MKKKNLIIEKEIKTTLNDYLCFYVGDDWENEEHDEWEMTDTRYFIGEDLEIPVEEVHKFLIKHKNDTIYVGNFGGDSGYYTIKIVGFGDKIIEMDAMSCYSLDWREED